MIAGATKRFSPWCCAPQKRALAIGATSALLWLCVACFLAAASAATSTARNPAAMTGDAFLQTCATPDPEFLGFCQGFVQGVHDAWADALCVPTPITRTELVTATVDLLQREPKLRELYAAAVVVALMKRRFPCPGDGARGK